MTTRGLYRTMLTAVSILAVAVTAGAADYNGNHVIASGDTVTLDDTWVSIGVWGPSGSLTVQGTLSCPAAIIGVNRGGNSATVAQLIVDGGSVTGNNLYAFHGSNGVGQAIIQVTNDGQLSIATNAYLGNGPGIVVFEQDSGSTVVTGQFRLGGAGADGSASATVSGGAFTVGSLALGATLPTEFNVVGSTATITVNGALSSTAATTLGFTFDASGVSTISAVSAVALAGTVDLTVLGALPVGVSVFDLITVTSGTLSLDSLVLSVEDQDAWRLQIGSDGQTLQAVVVPEPATMALMGLGLVGMAMRRRGASRR